MLRSVAAPAQTEVDLLSTTLTPAAIGTSAVGYHSGTGSIGADSFYYRGFTYQITSLRARSYGAGPNRSHFCLGFAPPYTNELRHRASLANLTLRIGDDAYPFRDALQTAGAKLCWYPRVAFDDVLEAGVAATLRITTAEMRPVLSIESEPRNGHTYLQGETLRFRIATEVGMRVRGQPTLALSMGGEIVAATGVRVGWFRSYVDFTYTVAAGDVDTNGVSVAANLSETGGSLQLNGGSLLDVGYAVAFLEFSGLPDQAGHKVNGDLADTTPPALANATVQYREVWLDYNEPLDTRATPGTGQFTVTVGGAAANIESVGFGSDRRLVLTLQTAVASGDTVLVSSTATIRDSSLNTEASPPTNYAVVNTTPAAAPTLALSLNEQQVVEGEEFELTVTLSQSVGHAVSVPLSASPRYALRGWLTSIGIPAGETEVTIPLTTTHLASRVFDVPITIAAGETDFYSGLPEVTLIALDRDGSYRYHVIPAMALDSVVEGAANTSLGVEFKVTAVATATNPPGNLPGSVLFAIYTASQTATLPGDFAVIARNVEILPEGFTFVETSQQWEATISVEVRILGDGEPEGDEYFDLLLSAAPGRALQNVNYCGSGGARECRISITILDDDSGVRVGLEARDGSQRISTAESSGEVEVDFVGFLPLGLETGPAMEFRIAAEDGTANLPADYGFSGVTGTSTTVRIGAADWVAGEENGEVLLSVRKPIRLDLTDDQLAENREAFGVRLGEPVNPIEYLEPIAGKQVVTVAIEDDDERGVIVSPTLLELLAGETGTYQVNLGSQPTGTVTVTLAGPDHEDLGSSPSTLTFTADNWSTAQAVSVEATDGFLVPDEATIDHEVTGADYADFAADSVTVRATNENDTDPLPQLGIADASAGEGDGTMSFEVTLSAASSEEVTVRYATEEGTAEADADFTAASGTVTFAAGVRTATIEVTLLDDSSDEMAEQFQVTLSNAANAEIDDDTADAEIEDDDGPPTASVRGGAASESSGELGFTVSLSAPSSFDVTMRYETVELTADGGGATEGTDYQATADSLTIAPGVTAVRVVVPILSDSLHEADETVGLALTRPTNVVFGANQANAIGTIEDDDDPPRLTVTGGTATEAGGSIPFTFELSEVSGLAVVVPYETQDETATAGADYQSSSGSLTVAAGQTQETVRVPLYRDVLTEPDETFGLLVDEDTLVAATYRAATSDPVGTILDSPGPGLTIGDAIATEVSGTIRFPVRVLGTNASAVTVSWTTRDGTAVAGSDYTAASGTLTIPAETREADITVTLLTDQTAEPDETFSVVLSNASGAALIDATAVGTITEGALPVMNVTAAQASEGATSLTFTVSLSEAGTNEIRANYRTSEVTATEDEDYTETSGVLTFAPSDLTEEVIVPILADSFDEPDETLLLTLSGIRNATLGANPATGTIQDDDDAPTVSISEAEATEGGILTFEVSLSAPSRRQVRVAYKTTDGTASEDDDYTAAEGTLTFAPGDTARQVRVSLQQDATYEPSETLSVGLDSPVNAAVSGEDGSAEGTILDDDVRAVVVNPSELTIPEGGERSYTIVLSSKPTGSVTVAIAVEGNTDVSTQPSTLTFTTQNWNTAQEVMVSAAEDGDRASETATIGHTVSGADYAAIVADSVAVEVTDGDTASTAIALSVEPKTVTESGGAQVVVVTAALNGATLLDPTVVTVTVQGDTATVTGDFAPVSAFSLTIPAEAAEGTRTFTLTPVDDDIDEGEGETVSVAGATATAGLIVTATKVTITDDDERGVTVRPRTLTVAENSTGEYTVVLESAPTGNVTVTLARSGSNLVTVPTAPLTFTTSDWATAQTVTVTAADDADAVNEEATVAHSVTGADYAGEPADSVQVTVADDERVATAIVLSATPSVLDEDGGATAVVIAAALDGATRTAPIAVTVAVGAAADAATAGTDYGTVSDFTITIAGGAASGAGTFTLTPMDDLVAEGDEVISVIGTTTATGLTVTGTAVTLADDERSSGRITLSANPNSVSEGGSATAITVTAALDGATRTQATAVTVSVGAGTDSATKGTDYQTVSDFTVTIPATMSSGAATFTLTPTQDLVGEGDERISVVGAAASFAVTATRVTLTDDETLATAVTLSASHTSVGEDDQPTVVSVTATLNDATRSTATAVTVSVGDRRDGATEGSDYARVADFTVTIPSATASGTGTFTLEPTQDTLGEGDESISVGGRATDLTVTGTTMMLTDAETASTRVTLSVEPASVGEEDSATDVVVTAELDEDSRGSATAVTVAVGNAGDGATEGTDYQVVGDLTVMIPAGMTSGTTTFTLTPRDDDLHEGNEDISLVGTTTAAGLSVTGAQVTITDDESAPMAITLSVQPPSVPENGGAQTVTVVATLDGGAFLAATVVTVEVGDTGDGATEGTDYGVVDSFSLTIAGGARRGTGTFRLTPTDDLIYEGTESVSVKGTTTVPDITVNGTELMLADSEIESMKVLLSADPVRVGEEDSATAVMVTAALDGGVLSSPTVVTVQVGAGGDSATEGTDYATVSDFTVTIGAGATSGTGTFTLTPAQDSLGEGDETISVGGSTTVAELTVRGTELTLVDDETSSTVITLSANPAAVGEGDSATAVVVTAMLNATARQTATAVTVAVGDAGDSATEGTDYATVSNFTVTIGAGATSGTGTFTLTPTQDLLAEGDEAISVGGSATGLTVTGASVTLEDDETASTAVTLSVNPTRVGEADAATAVVVTAALDGGALGSATAVTVVVGDTGDSATEGTDYATVSNFAVTIGAGATSGTGTFTFTPTQDSLGEGIESITVGGTATGLTVTGTSLTLTDDETVSRAVTLSVNPTSVGEADAATAVVVTAALDGGALGSATAVTVAVGDAGDSATEGTDYAAVADFTVTIGAGATSGTGTFTLTPTQDSLGEGNESITVGGTATDLTVTGTSLTLTDDETVSTAVTLSVNPTSVGEADAATAVVVTAALDGGALGSATAVTVAVGDAGDSATEGTDYATVADFTVTIGAGATSGTGTFTFTPTQDSLGEGIESITVGGTATGLTVTGTSLTLTDDETVSRAVTLSVNPTSVGEADAATAVVVTAALDGGALGSATAVTVAVGDAGDSATEGTDYAAVADFTVTIGAGATSGTGTFTLTPTQDSLGEGNESITVGGTATDLTVTGTSLTLTDDETVSTAVTLSVNPTSVGEADAATAVVVTAALDGGALGSATAVTVAVGDAGDSATEGTDYAAVADFTVTIGAGATSGTGTFTLTPTQDSLGEGNESITVGGTATGLTVTGTSLTLTDDETVSTGVTLSVNPTSVGEADAATAVVVTAALDGGALGSATAVTVAVGDAGDSATEGTDYATVADFTVTIGAGATSGTGTFTLTPTQDSLGEGNESITVGGTATGLTVTGTSLTLTDDETVSTGVTLSVNPTSVGEADAATAVVVTAALDGGALGSATAVTVAVGDAGDSATEGTDYATVSDFTVTIGAGATSGTGTFTLTPTQDSLGEGNESITVGGTATGLTVTGTSLTLTDDETVSTGVTLSVNPTSVGEADAATAVVVTAALDGGALGSATAVTVAVGDTGDSATEGTDYQTVSDFTVTIGAGATSGTGTFTLTPTQDSLGEGNESITVGGTATGLTVTGTSLTLTDDETASTGVTLSVNPTRVGEADAATAVVVTATLNGAARGSATAVTVAVGYTGDSATEGTDYATVSDFTVTIGAGATSGTGTFTLTPTQDTVGEGDETISVGGTATGLTVTGASLTLTDDETASTAVTLSVNPTSVGESASATAVTVTATLNGAARGSATAVTVAVGYTGDSATEGTDYQTVSNFTVTIGAGATSGTGTFTLTPTQDTVGEGDEAISVEGTTTIPGLVVTGTALTLTDDETISTGVTLSVNPTRVGEADAATAVTVTATLNGGARGSATAVTVAVGYTGDSATEGTDYQTVADFTVTIGAGATSGTGTFTLTPTQDTVGEGDEAISVEGTTTILGLVVTGTALTLTDDETISTGVTLSVNPTSVGESASATTVTVTATLNGAVRGSATAVTVAVGDTGDSATEGTDYATVAGFTVTIGADATSGTGTFTLTPTQDIVAEGDETISVEGTATGLTVTGTSVTLEDDETASTGVTLSVNPTSKPDEGG